jgi:hypothetical protein
MNRIICVFKGFFKLTTICFALFLSACTAQYIQPQTETGQNNARISIVRPSELWGSALRAPIYVNNQYIGRIGNGGQLTWITKPGKVTVATSEGTIAILIEKRGPSYLSFDAKKGHTYTVNVISPLQVQFTAPFGGEAAFQLKLIK